MADFAWGVSAVSTYQLTVLSPLRLGDCELYELPTNPKRLMFHVSQCFRGTITAVMEKYCKCGNLRRVGGRYCSACHSKWMREFRATHPMTEEQKRKDNCRSFAGEYLRRGKIK